MVHKIGPSPISLLAKNALAYATHGDKQAKHDQGKKSVKVARRMWQGHLVSSCIISYIIWPRIKLALQATSMFYLCLIWIALRKLIYY